MVVRFLLYKTRGLKSWIGNDGGEFIFWTNFNSWSLKLESQKKFLQNPAAWIFFVSIATSSFEFEFPNQKLVSDPTFNPVLLPENPVSILTPYLCWLKLISWPNVLLHISQAYGLFPLCDLRACTSSPCGVLNIFSHLMHEYTSPIGPMMPGRMNRWWCG